MAADWLNLFYRVFHDEMSFLEFCQVHVTLLGQGFVQGKCLVKSVAGLALFGNLEVIPHKLLVVGMNAVLNDALGALGGRLAAKIGNTLLGDEHLDAVLVVIHV